MERRQTPFPGPVWRGEVRGPRGRRRPTEGAEPDARTPGSADPDGGKRPETRAKFGRLGNVKSMGAFGTTFPRPFPPDGARRPRGRPRPTEGAEPDARTPGSADRDGRKRPETRAKVGRLGNVKSMGSSEAGFVRKAELTLRN